LEYKIAFKKSVTKDLKKISRESADRILTKLATDLPQKADTLPILQGQFSGLKKYRIGDYRIIFSTFKETLLILRIQHRKEVYKNKAP